MKITKVQRFLRKSKGFELFINSVSLAASHPHFLYGDNVLRESVEGLKPDKEKHTSFTEVEPKHDLMNHVAHQIICMQYILELAKQLDCDPRACVDAFFAKIQVAEVEYKQSFDDELRQFKERIRKRAAEKLEEAIKV
uniref:Hsp90 co-chaperone Cdc37-like n=1 Tax=Diabrotica virgifera virgifera TaxID=50390 RepID=A0A6P7FA55_DIAVI